jgi:hypothetical protein
MYCTKNGCFISRVLIIINKFIQMSEKSDASIEIEIDQNDINIDEPHNDNDKPPHNGKSITKVEVSPNEKYLVTYSQDDRSIVGWNVEDVDEGQLKPEFSLEIYDISDKESQICVSDDKKFAYINYNNRLGKYKFIHTDLKVLQF